MDDGSPRGLPQKEEIERFKFTSDQVLAMIAADILDDNVELIDGDIYPMMTKHDPHEIAKRKIVYWLIRNLDDAKYLVGLEQTIFLAPRDAPDPDISIFPAHMKPTEVRGADSLLVIEIADSSIPKDTKLKAPRYAKHGVRHYWVVDVIKEQTLCYSAPAKAGYPEPQAVPFDQPLTLPFAPALAFTISRLP
jgi:Uma2 family endonuclease